MPTSQEILNELYRLEAESTTDISQPEQSLASELYILGAIALAFIGFILNQEAPFAISLAFAIFYQVYSRGSFDNIFTFIPLGLYMFYLWKLSYE